MTAAALTVAAQATSAFAVPPSHYVLYGDFYPYGGFGQGSVIDTFGPAEGSFGISYTFPGGTSAKNVNTSVGLASNEGLLSISLGNQSNLQATEVDGNDHGGGVTINADVYVEGPPGTHFFIESAYAGNVTAVHGGGAGTTQAHAQGVTAVVNNSAGTQSLPIALGSGRIYGGVTSSSPHPSIPGYYFATTASASVWGFTFQSISFCFPSCPTLTFTGASALGGAVNAGPCCPKTYDFERWNDDPRVTRRNNCTNYGLNRSTVTGAFTQPGNIPPNLPDYSCALVEGAVVPWGIYRVADPNSCAASECSVALVVARALDNFGWRDYHWYRRNCDGTWSHKQGGTPAKNTDSADQIITDPFAADRTVRDKDGNFVSPGYTQFCGYYCVPCNFSIPLPPVPRAADDSSWTASVLVQSGLDNPQWVVGDSTEVGLLQQMVYSGTSVPGPIVERASMGYAGVSLFTDTTIVGIPEYVRALDGIIEIFEADSVTYRTDSMGLEDYLVARAIELGYTSPLLGGATSGPTASPGNARGLRLDVSPNPVANDVVLRFNVRRGDHVKLEIFDVTGRSVATLLDGPASGGDQSLTWTAPGVSTGIYFARLTVGQESRTKRLAIIR